VLNPDRHQDYLQLLDETRQRRIAVSEVIHLWSCARGRREVTSLYDLETSLGDGVKSLFLLVRALMKEGRERKPSLRVVTVGTQAVEPGGLQLSPENAPVWGLAKTIWLEDAAIACRAVDVNYEPTQAEMVAERLIEEFQTEANDREVAFCGADRFVPSVRPIDFISLGRRTVPLRHRGVYLITGGLGGIGLEVARWLAERYDARLVLLGRTALPDKSVWDEYMASHPADDKVCRRIVAVRSLESLGGEVWTPHADVADLEDMTELVARIRERFGEMNGVFHAAGVIQDAGLADKSPHSFDAVLHPKVHGTWVLDQATQSEELDIFVLFSSIASILGSPRQADYVAANAYLDCFAQARNAQGRPTVSINWGLWGEVGMGVAVREAVQKSGILEPMSSRDALTALERALSFDCPQLIVAAPGLRFVEILKAAGDEAPGVAGKSAGLPGKALGKALSNLGGEVTTANAVSSERTENRPEGAETAGPVVESIDDAETLLVRWLSQMLEVDPEQLDRRKSFPELGMDSVLVVQLTRKLEATFGGTYSYDVLREFPTIPALAGYLFQRDAGDEALPADAPPNPRGSDDAIE
jgi:polyketide synthase PksN